MTLARLVTAVIADKDHQPEHMLLARWYGGREGFIEPGEKEEIPLPLWTSPCMYVAPGMKDDAVAQMLVSEFFAESGLEMDPFGPEIRVPLTVGTAIVRPYLLIRTAEQMESLKGTTIGGWKLIECEAEMAWRLGTKELWMHTILERLWRGSVRQLAAR